MIRNLLILVSLIWLSGCSGATFERGLNYEKSSEYSFDYDKGTHITAIINKKNGNRIGVMFGTVACGYYGLIGPIIFPVIPFWQNRDCGEAVIGIGAVKDVYISYHDKTYKPSEISVNGYYYTFPLQVKSITDTAILVVEKNDGEKFEIPFRYQHTFSFDLVPGR